MLRGGFLPHLLVDAWLSLAGTVAEQRELEALVRRRSQREKRAQRGGRKRDQPL
jgi:hypothetical protein